jgi:pimeloyl-ACP methyl ester carboxylesterase
MTEFTTRTVRIFYKDWGAGPPIVFSHGSPVLLIRTSPYARGPSIRSEKGD